MSRESNSSSSGPHGRGGPSYAPGTEPYGDPGAGRPSDPDAIDEDAPASPDEPKTETTLTTRIRINIPGSRPIPPVVMRKPVGEAEDARGEHERSPEAEGAVGGPDGAVSPTGSAGGSAGVPGATGGTAATPGDAGSGGGGGDSGPTPTSDWFAPRKPPRPTPEPDPLRDDTGPGARGTGAGEGPYGAGSYDAGRTSTPPDGFPTVGPPSSGGGSRSALSDFVDGPPPGPLSTPPSGFDPGAPADQPTGRTTGPQSGDMPLPPRPPRPGPPTPDGSPPGGRSGAERPAGSALGPAPGVGSSSLYTHGPTPPSPTGGRDDEHVTSDTLVSGIPRMPSVDSVFPPDAPAPAASDHGYFDRGRDEHGESHEGDRGDRDRHDQGGGKGARSKLVLAGVSLVGVVALAYGAGLLLDHADVPNGTTVLGVDIGGKSQQDAVNTLDAALESRMSDPLTLVVGGKETPVKPEIVGLGIDTEETVREASGQDYNPVSVIGSLFGGSRVVEAHVKVDDEKLRSAVASLAGPGGDAKDGMVVFTGGEAQVRPGKPHKAVDVNKAVTLVEDAYRERAATGQTTQVPLPVSMQKPQFGEKELQAAADGFGETAMSGWVWVRAGGVEVPFSEQTIGSFLTMQSGGDTLQPVIDTDKLAAAYGSAFDGVVVEGGAGTVPLTSKHVAAAMIQALQEPAPALPEKRVAEVPGSSRQ